MSYQPRHVDDLESFLRPPQPASSYARPRGIAQSHSSRTLQSHTATTSVSHSFSISAVCLHTTKAVAETCPAPSDPPTARHRQKPHLTPMSLPSSTPPLLLTKRLTAFLQANSTPSLPTLLLLTPQGKLLAHASPHPVAQLRTHATVAASLLAIHTSSSLALPHALPGSRTPAAVPSPTSTNDDDDDTPLEPPRSVQPVTITVQLSGGTVVVRRLKCGLLFVCVGPPAETQELDGNGAGPELVPGSPSEVESLVSVGGQTTSSLESVGAAAMVAMRRQAAELTRWLDDKLGTLKVPEQSVGVE